MHVHAVAVVANERLGHEGRCFTVSVRDVVDDVLENLKPVGTFDQGVELGANLTLTGRGNFVVMGPRSQVPSLP